MSDVAAGSDAALRLQQNMAAAPYVQQETAAAAEQTQLKLQQDRLKAQYAPQEMALKQQQEQLAIETSTNANLASKYNLQVNQDSRDKFKNLVGKDEFKTADEVEKLKLIRSTFGETGDLKGYIEANKAVSKATAEKIQADLKQHEQERLQLGDALSWFAGAKPEEMPELISKMDDKMKANIKSHLPGFFEEKNSERQRAQLEALFYNGLGKNGSAEHATRLELLNKQLEIREEQLKNIEQTGKNNQAKGNDGSKERAEELKAFNAAQRTIRSIDLDSKKDRKELEDQYNKDFKKDQEKRLFGFGSSPYEQAKTDADKKQKLKSTQSWNDLQEFNRTVVQKKINAIESMPEGPDKQKQLSLLEDELATTYLSPEEKKEAKPKERSLTTPSPAPGGPLPSNLSGGPLSLQDTAKAAADLKKPGVVPSNKYTQDNPAKPTSKEEYDKLPSGSYYIQDGVIKRKKG